MLFVVIPDFTIELLDVENDEELPKLNAGLVAIFALFPDDCGLDDAAPNAKVVVKLLLVAEVMLLCEFFVLTAPKLNVELDELPVDVPPV